MALNFSASYLSQVSSSPTGPQFLVHKHKHLFKLYPSSFSAKTSAQSEGTASGVTEQDPPSSPGSLSSTRTQLDLLEQLTSDGYESDGSSGKLTIREQLAQLAEEGDGDFSIALCKKDLKKVSAKPLTVSQKRNIRRQAYLNEVSQRNDSVFFATIGAFIILPPIIILGIAILTGYVQLLP
ncbi:MYOSIN-G HEAVY CHAIN-LIKE PROTEIN [Salix koriyanagi]|uniref:MYOSIN-G HEAVY CHAIN-LIKE PROTEIN n=1 Tax=Salix koriyanagi TaxID=2511006 RepID=A0A9Q0TCK4_9ROSI|nr:MYOSIN-G HEAVY CHAIN-LIKE PROTEIN [Salix koriyanagi]